MSELDADIGTEQDISMSEEAPEAESSNLEEAEDIGAPDDEAEAPEAEAAPEEMAVIDFEGEQFEVPPILREAFLRNKDYTQKTQEIAEQRRELEAKFEQATQQAQASDDFIQHKAHLHNVSAQLEQYENVDWQALNDQDPMGAQQHFMQFQQLKEAKQQAEQGITAFEQQRTEQRQLEENARFQQADAWARQNIPNWSDEKGKELLKFATQDLKAPVDLIRQYAGPELFQTLHLAKLGKATLERGTKPHIPSAKPLRKVATKASPPASKNLADMDMDEYVAHRSRQGG